ncbi:MAG: cobalamin-dependent protein [Planctomycetota bacterium]|nr:cobalamin-dependent protein [Planctomycetota bacterium]
MARDTDALRTGGRRGEPAVRDGDGARVLLVSANREKAPHPVYPLALDYLRESLQTAGHRCAVFDCGLAENPAGELEAYVRRWMPDLVGISIRNVDNSDSSRPKLYVPDAVEAVAAVRRASEARIVLGGSGFSLFPHELLSATGADMGVVGPGESVLSEIVSRTVAGEDPSGLPGLARLDGDLFAATPPAPPARPPAAPGRDEGLLRRYWAAGGPVNMLTSRGCPNRCVYCTYPMLDGPAAWARDPADAADEIAALNARFGVDSFFIADSIFNADPLRPRMFAGELLRRKLKVRWTAFFSPAGMTADAAAALKASGLEGVELGAESLCDVTLRAYGKFFSAADAVKCVQACAAADLPCLVYLILGGPGETEETLRETLSRALELPRAVFTVFCGMRIYPGTPLHGLAVREGIVSEGESLLEPKFYFSPALSRGLLEARCAELSRRPNWLIAGHGMEAREKMAALFRASGAKGSLWHLLRP